MQILIKIIVALLLPLGAYSQISFYKHYSNSGSDFAQGVVQLEDSSYAVCGSSSSFTSGHTQAFLMRVDSMGNLLWSNSYGGFEQESARRVLYKKDYGYLLAGYTNSIGNGAYDYYLTKISEAGIQEWETSFGGSGWDRINDAAMTRDTGAILIGESNSTQNGDNDWFIVRTDSNGDTLWTKYIGGAGDDRATCIEPYQDSMFIVGGDLYVADSLKTKMHFVYIHENGTIIDKDTVGDNGDYFLNDITILNDIVQGIGTHKIDAATQYNVVLMTGSLSPTEVDVFGHFIWSSSGDFTGNCITHYGDGTGRYMSSNMENEANAYTPGKGSYCIKINFRIGMVAELHAYR